MSSTPTRLYPYRMSTPWITDVSFSTGESIHDLRRRAVSEALAHREPPALDATIPYTSFRRTAKDARPPRQVVTRALLGDPAPGRSAQDQIDGLTYTPQDPRSAANVQRLGRQGMSALAISLLTGVPVKSVEALVRRADPYKQREASHPVRRA